MSKEIGHLREAWESHGFLVALAFALISVALSQSHWRRGRRLVYFFFPISLALGFAWWTNWWEISIAIGLGWMIFPVIQMVVLTRKHRVMRYRTLEHLLTYRREFEVLREMSAEWEQLGFEEIENYELKPSDPRQVFRFLISKDKRYFVVVGWTGQGDWAFIYSAVSSWSVEGLHWMTWNYPLPYGLKVTPEVRLWRCSTAESPDLLLQQHMEFLRLNQVEAKARPDLAETDAACKTWLGWFEQQLDYNLKQGWLRFTKETGLIRYSWRGTWGAMGQVFRILLS